MRLSTVVFGHARDTFAGRHRRYQRIVEYYARAFWLAGAADQFLRNIEAVAAQYQLPPLDEGLSRLLAQVYRSPYNQYLLTVSLSTAGLWYRGAGGRLLDTLRTLTDDGSPS